MNLRKGFFRLTLVLSILAGIISSFPLLEDTIKNKDGIVRKSLPYGLQIMVSNEGIDGSSVRFPGFNDLPYDKRHWCKNHSLPFPEVQKKLIESLVLKGLID